MSAPIILDTPTELEAENATFRAMGSDAHVIVVGGTIGLIEHARWRIGELEQRWSRFLPDSEISRLNRTSGEWTAVSPDTVLLIEQARHAWSFSGGAFDPTVLGDVIRAGYDRSFAEVSASPGAGLSVLQSGCDGIEVLDGRVRLPAGTGFDPGGIGKGLAADLVVRWLLDEGAAGACVNIGGDLRVAGIAPGGEGWRIGITRPEADATPDLPANEVTITEVTVSAGAVATSTTLRRRWDVDGSARHHLIDPQTGEPSTTDLALASVIAGEAWAAEVLAKAVLLKGASYPFDILGGTGAEGLAVGIDGAVQMTPGMARFATT